MDEQVPDPPDAKVAQVVEHELEKRSRGRDVQRPHLLAEEAERRNRAGAFLDFVEENECLSGNDRNAGLVFDLGDDLPDIQIAGERIADSDVLLEIDFDIVVEGLGQMTDGRGLARLSRSAEQQRLVSGVVLPIQKGVVDLPFDIHQAVFSVFRHILLRERGNCNRKTLSSENRHMRMDVSNENRHI